MKKLTLIFFMLIFFQITASSQTCLPCLPEGITFNTQNQIDSFQINNPGCTEIEGYVEINGGDITNLDGLNVLTAFGGNVWIKCNTALTSFTGLDNLTFIGGDLLIMQNIALVSLAGLENLNYIMGDMEFGSMFSSGLGNPLLTNLIGLNNLDSIGGSLGFYDNGALTSLTGLESLISIGGTLSIGSSYGIGNPSLSSLTGLNNLASIGSNLFIIENDSLHSLEGLNNLNSIGLVVDISGNSSLTSLSGLENLISIGMHLIIGNNWSQGNPSLTNLTGLINLNSIGGMIRVYDNEVLTSLLGLDNIAAGSIDDLDIIYNSSLSTCAVQSICDYLANPTGTISIHDNAIGCNSQQEVEDACEALPVENINFEEGLSIYPNPANQEVFISISNGVVITEITIYNQIGQKVLHHKSVNQPIDVSMLRQGMYIIEVAFGSKNARRKLIVE